MLLSDDFPTAECIITDKSHSQRTEKANPTSNSYTAIIYPAFTQLTFFPPLNSIIAVENIPCFVINTPENYIRFIFPRQGRSFNVRVKCFLISQVPRLFVLPHIIMTEIVVC